MKRILAVMVGVALVGGVAAAEPIDASSKITDVTVFPDRALVTRRAELRLPPGLSEVLVGPLPGAIEEDSVSAKGEGETKVKLLGAKVVTRQLETAPSPKVHELEEQIKRLGDQMRQEQNAKEVSRQKREFLASIKAASVQEIGKDIITKLPSAADISGLLTTIEEGLASTYQKDLEVDIALRKLQEELDKVQRELAQLRGVGGRQETAIVVELEAENAGRFDLEVSYRVPGATWEPVYEARANGEGSMVELTSYGVIRQNTGEDWSDVSVSLSTAKPAIGGRMPELEPWWLRKSEPVELQAAMSFERKRAYGKRADVEEGLAKNGAPADALKKAALQEVSEIAQASAATKGPAVVFTLARRETILADWQPRKSPIAVHALPAQLAYEVTPKLSPYAYLRAKTTNNTDLVLLPGSVQVFLDGAFVDTSSLNLVGPGEEFNLFLGIDERIRVKRKQLKAFVDVSLLPGLHGRIKTIDYNYLTTIENFRKTAAAITVIDQIPVSQHEEIKIENVVYDPKPTVEDKEKPGVRRWTLSIPAGAKQSLKLSYRVTHPVDLPVEGL